MIDIYFWRTPNGSKITIFAEETGLKYRIVPVDITQGDQFEPGFLKISPNNRMPAIIDPDGPDGKPIAVFESGAILFYLAEKTGLFMPQEPRGRYEVLQWLMFQMANIGPMIGQAHHFRMYAPEPIPYAVDRYTNEAARLYSVLDRRLADREYLAGEYSIADMATLPWIMQHKRHVQNLDDFPSLRRWYEALKARPAVRRGMEVGKDLIHSTPETLSDEARSTLFGAKHFEPR